MNKYTFYNNLRELLDMIKFEHYLTMSGANQTKTYLFSTFTSAFRGVFSVPRYSEV